ncbi:NB-ARC domain-containing disease resistance protein [Melia azedarach]|uniref:NB-ARC domain-containing disease resistance protein n=1 Tax=Melia azedarach TaxID=155640 RepID=A0ACC1WUY0_MELAZ|nr:NB-ARC domain-containing disease resistance protein [Melia azedarach]
MVDAIISPILEHLISMAVEEATEQVCLVIGIREEMVKLNGIRENIQAAFVEAERSKMKAETRELWLDKLRDLFYDMEDVLDEWNYNRLKFQIEGVAQKKVFPFPVPCSCFKRVVLDCGIASKIKEINEKLDSVTQQRNMFNPNVNDITVIETRKQGPTISMIDESEIVGRVTEKNYLVSKLICEGSGEQKDLHIISLVGTGGIGKTTVAQLAFNDAAIKRTFKKRRIWVSVSDTFDPFKIARAIIERLNAPTFDSVEPRALKKYLDKSMTEKKFPRVLDDHMWTKDRNKVLPTDFVELEAIMQAIHDIIKGKKFLLVLDDVWEEDHIRWEPFCHCLKNGSPGSKILITTRKDTVARMMKSDVIPIKELTDEECWLLLEKITFSGRSNEEDERLEAIGRRIAGKCKGLPRVAKTVGKVLCSERTEEYWRSILNSEMWKLEEFKKYLLSTFLLSYNDLPSMTARRCFSYCAIFPKGYNISKEELVQLWMAQGFLTQNENEDMEVTGAKYFDNIVSQSFFQELEKDDYEVSGFEESVINSLREKVCHLTIMLGEGAAFPASICNVKRLRSLFIDGAGADYSSVRDVLPRLFGELKCLRALDMHGVVGCQNLIREIPEEVAKLIHLAYLNLSGQEMERLPETICRLYNLQTLNISRCQFLRELPQGTGNLINLRHLLNNETRALSFIPVGIERLTHLRTLRSFVVGGGVQSSKGCKLKSLENLNLFGSCQIRGLGNVSNVSTEAERLPLQIVRNLVDLCLEFNKDEEGERTQREDEELLVTLQPPQNLKRLKIGQYRGNTFPSGWMMLLTSVTELCLTDCLNCMQLPPLGKLSSLQKLSINNLQSVNSVGDEFLGIDSDEATSAIAFLKLKSLVISNMENLKDWHYHITSTSERRIRIMPRLSSLEIHSCPILKALPDNLFQTERLNIEKSVFLEDILRRRRRED